MTARLENRTAFQSTICQMKRGGIQKNMEIKMSEEKRKKNQ